MSRLTLISVLICAVVTGASAGTLQVQADSYLESSYGGAHGDRNYGGSDQLQARDSSGRTINLRFDVSGLPTINSAVLMINPNNYTDQVDVYALNDGVTPYTDGLGYGRLGEGWTEGVGDGWDIYTKDASNGDDPTNSDTSNDNWLTYNNAPGNASYYDSDPNGTDHQANWSPDTNVTLLGDNAAVGAQDVNGWSSIDLTSLGVDAINNDTDGMVTVILVNPNGKLYVKSREDSSGLAPYLSYTVPEPMTLTLLGLGGLGVLRKRRRA